MRHLAPLAAILVLASGCMLVFDDGGSSPGDDGGDDDCVFPEPSPPALSLLNPDTLLCELWGGGGPCDPRCGPCPAVALSTPPPSWGSCGSQCESLSEAACAESPFCRVVKDAACAISGGCTTDYLGCFPTDQFTEPTIDCFMARDGQTCSRSAACTAFHRGAGIDPRDARTFAMCAPEGEAPGTCFGEVVCARPPPGCPPDRRPGVAGGCYTGTCIPVDVCEPAPQQ
jgi:hypothetical protein